MVDEEVLKLAFSSGSKGDEIGLKQTAGTRSERGVEAEFKKKNLGTTEPLTKHKLFECLNSEALSVVHC